MAPRNLLRMKEALLSLLAGDIFGATPIWPSVRAFKMTYSVFSLAASAPQRAGTAPAQAQHPAGLSGATS